MISKLIGIGLNVDLNHFDTKSINKIITSLKKLRIKWIRVEIDYFKYQSLEKRKFLFYLLASCKKENILVVGLFSQFVAGNFKSIFFPDVYHKPVIHYLDEYVRFVEDIVNNYKDYIYYWEIWNEQNSKRFWINPPNAKEYVNFLAIITNLIKKVDPTSKIIFGGIVGNDVTPLFALPESITQYKNFIEESISYGADRYVDHYGFHPYTLDCYISFKNKYQLLDIIKERIYETRSKYEKRSLIITEFGISHLLQLQIKEEDIAYIYRNLYQFLEALDIPICFYTLIDLDNRHFSRLNPEAGFGLLNSSLEEKKLFTTLLNSLQEA